ncbi:MAG TPA: TonB-dependent receptor [Gemmatimonadaceae bacterium]|nr:TonB-dependent receptor [Gemmatimonadaceae bacterium]
MPVMARSLALIVLLIGAPFEIATAIGTPVSGQIRDRAGRPISGATVSIVELKRGATTDRDGRFLLSDVPAGNYTLTARHLGFAPAAQSIRVSSAAIELSVTLREDVARVEPLNVTATRTPISEGDSPLASVVLSGDEVHQEGNVSLAHSIAKLPGVRSVTSGQQIGKPMIRGLFGPRVLVLTDGSRLEDYSWSDEDGPSLDARIADHIEVIRGPASVLYGSDALSGVVNVIPSELSYSPDGSSTRNEALEVYGGSGNIELGGAALVNGSWANKAWRVMGTGRFSQNYQTPDGEMPNSSFFAVNGEAAFGIRHAAGSTTFRGAHYGGEFHLLEASGPEPGDPDGGPVRQVLDDRLQITDDRLAGGMRLETKVQLQRHGLSEVSDDCVPPPGQTTCTKVKDQQAFGLALNTAAVEMLAHHGNTAGLAGTVGVSGMAQLSSSSGPIFLVPGATVISGAGFAFEQYSAGRVAFVAGVRADERSLSSEARPEISRAADSRSWSALSGDVGVIVHLTPHLAANANFGTGWRAPTLFDLYANGPNQADVRYEVGDPTLGTEQSRTLDASLRWSSDRFRMSVTAFDNLVDDFIFTNPTGAVQNSLPVFQHTQTNARLSGGEATVEAQVTSALVLRASHDRVQGDERDNEIPLPLMPPPRTIVGAEIATSDRGAFRHVRLGGEVEIDQKQTRLNPNDFATDGFSLVNLDLSFEHPLRGRPGRFDVVVRNALNTSYRDFLSRFKTFATAPGVSVVVKASAGAW